VRVSNRFLIRSSVVVIGWISAPSLKVAAVSRIRNVKLDSVWVMNFVAGHRRASPTLTQPHYHRSIITPAASSGKHNVTVWRPSVCPVDILIVTRQGAACDAASKHFGLAIRRSDILIC